MREDIRKKVIDSVCREIKWLTYMGWSNKEKEYDLLKFVCSTDGSLIMWIYLKEDSIDLEFRKDGVLDKEYRDATMETINNIIEEVKYLY